MSESVDVSVDCLSEDERNRWPVKKSTAFYAFFVIFMLALLDMADRQILAALFPYLKVEFGFTDSQLGFLASLVNFGLVVMAIPTAYLVDRWSRKKMLAVMTLIWSGATAACAFVSGYAHLAICRFFVGAGEAGYLPAGQTILACSFPKKYQTAAIAVTTYGMTIGAMLGLLGAAYIASHWGWRHAFGVFAIPGIILGIMCLFMKDFKVKSVEPSCHEGANTGESLAKASYGKVFVSICKTPTLVYGVLAHSLILLVTSAMQIWMPTYFTRAAGVAPTVAAMMAAITMFVSFLGAIAGASLIDWLRKQGMSLVLIIMCGLSLFALAAKLLAFGVVTPGTVVQLSIIVLAGLATTPASIVGSTLVADLSLPQHRATAVSLMVVVQNICGMALGPMIMGFVADMFSLPTAILLLSCLLMVSALLYFLASRTYKQDMMKMEKVIIEF